MPLAIRVIDRWQDLSDVDFASFGDREIPVWDVTSGKLMGGIATLDSTGLLTATGATLSGGYSPTARLARLRSVTIPRTADLTDILWGDFQDELAFVDKRASTTVTVTGGSPVGASANLFRDDVSTVSWAAATSPYPIVIEIDMLANPISANSSGNYQLGLTFRSTGSHVNTSNIQIELWDNGGSVYSSRLNEAAAWIQGTSGTGSSVYISGNFTTPDANGNVYKIRITLTGTNPVTTGATIRLQRVILYHRTATWNPWHLHRTGGTLYGSLTFDDAANVVAGTTTGTKIGTATSQKLGFFNATPIVQPSSTTDLRTALINLGLYATGGATPLNLNGGALTAQTATLSGLTLGSVVYAGTAGLLSQDNSNFFWDATNHRLGIGTTSPATPLHVLATDSATAAATVLSTRGHNSSGTPAPGFGSEERWQLASSTTVAQDAASQKVLWRVATHASRAADLVWSVYDATAAREALRMSTDGTVAYSFLTGNPPASASLSKLGLGSALSGGSSSGTYLGINAASGYGGRFAEFQKNGISKLRINSTGSVAIGSRSAGFTNTTFSVDVDSDGPTNEFLFKQFDITLPTDNSTFKGLYIGLGQGSSIATGWGEIGLLDESTGTIRMMNFQRTGAATGQTMFWGDFLMAQNNKALQFSRTDSAPLQVFKLDASDNLIVSLAYTGVTSMSMRWVVDSPTSTWKWMHTFDTIEVMQLTGAGLLTQTVRDAATNAVTVGATLKHNTSGTPAAGFGGELRLQLESTTTEDRDAAAWRWSWPTATDASRKARMLGLVWDTAEREWIRGEASGSAAMIGFLGASALGVQTVNAAATDAATNLALTNQIRAALVSFGLLA
jgi:hypothetical protein